MIFIKIFLLFIIFRKKVYVHSNNSRKMLNVIFYICYKFIVRAKNKKKFERKLIFIIYLEIADYRNESLSTRPHEHNMG